MYSNYSLSVKVTKRSLHSLFQDFDLQIIRLLMKSFIHSFCDFIFCSTLLMKVEFFFWQVLSIKPFFFLVQDFCHVFEIIFRVFCFVKYYSYLFSQYNVIFPHYLFSNGAQQYLPFLFISTSCVAIKSTIEASIIFCDIFINLHLL